MRIITAIKDFEATPRVSIVVVTKAFPNENCDSMLDSTVKINSKFEIIIVSTNTQKAAIVESYLGKLLDRNPRLVKIKVALMDFDRGPSYGRNLGVALAKSSYILFADDDVTIVDDVDPLLQYLEASVCQGIQPLILRFSDPGIVDSAGDFVRKDKWKSYVPYCKGAGMHINDLHGDLHIEEIPSMRSAFMVVAREALLSVDAFDSTFNFAYEDVDLGWRMLIAGYRLLFMPTVKVLHKGGRGTDPTKTDENVYKLALLNYYAMHLKITNHTWPLILARFYNRLIHYETWRVTKVKVSLIDAVRDFMTMNKLFSERVNLAMKHKTILAKKFHFRGKKKLEEMAEGKRFIYNMS
jgi:GT2 family glycosyltransferase